MNTQADPEDERLGTLLRQARPAPALTPRFNERVWHRIEREEAGVKVLGSANLAERIVGWLLKPRTALAAAALVILLSGFAGALSGANTARETARDRYLAAVAPNMVR